MAPQQKEKRIGFLEGRIRLADQKADLASSIVEDAADELLGAKACGLDNRAEKLTDRVHRQSIERDIWAAAGNALRAERDGLECELLNESRQLGQASSGVAS